MKVAHMDAARSKSAVSMMPFKATGDLGGALMEKSLDLLEQAMPSLPQLGAALLVLVAYLALTGSGPAMNADTQAVLQQAQEAAAAAVPGYRPY